MTTTSTTDLPKHPRSPDGRFLPMPLTPASSYAAKHGRVRYLRGKASSYACVDCGKPARHWSTTTHGRDGLDIFADYRPRCVLDHLLYDQLPFLLRHGETAVTRAKLTREQVLEIKALHDTGQWTRRQLAAKFGVSDTTIYNITHGRRWRWLLEPEPA